MSVPFLCVQGHLRQVRFLLQEERGRAVRTEGDTILAGHSGYG